MECKMITEYRPITFQQLIKVNACVKARTLFFRKFGISVVVTPELCRSVAHEFDFHWAALNLLSPAAHAKYTKAIALLTEEYDKAIAPFGTEYRKAEAPLRIGYEKAEVALMAKYKKDKAPLRAEYERADNLLLKEYKKARAALWEEFRKAEAPFWVEYKKAIAAAFATCYIGDVE